MLSVHPKTSVATARWRRTTALASTTHNYINGQLPINVVPLAANAEPALPSDEGEVAAELEEEALELRDERGLDLGFAVLVLEIEEFEDVRILDFLLRRDDVVWRARLPFAKHGRFVPRKGRALVELASDLAVQLAHRPAAAKGLRLVEAARLWIGHTEQADVVRPRQREHRDPGERRSG